MMAHFTKAEIIEAIRIGLESPQAYDHTTASHLVAHQVNFHNPEELILTFDNGAEYRVNIIQSRKEEV